MKEYALYKGEEILAIGTINEIAEKTGVKKETIAYYKTPTYKKRNTTDGNSRVLVCLDEQEV